MKHVKLFEQFEESLNENRETTLSPILLLMGEAGFIKQGETSTDEFDHENYVFSGGNEASWLQIKDDLQKLMKKKIYGQEDHFSNGKDYAIKLNKDKKSVTLIALKDKIPATYFKTYLDVTKRS